MQRRFLIYVAMTRAGVMLFVLLIAYLPENGVREATSY